MKAFDHDNTVLEVSDWLAKLIRFDHSQVLACHYCEPQSVLPIPPVFQIQSWVTPLDQIRPMTKEDGHISLLFPPTLLLIRVPKRLLDILGLLVVFRVVVFQAIALGESGRNAAAALATLAPRGSRGGSVFGGGGRRGGGRGGGHDCRLYVIWNAGW